MVVKGKKSKNPPIMSHEFVIQNHADIVAVIAMIFMLGLMVESLHPLASSFIAMSHNMTYPDLGLNGNDLVLFRPGPKDMLAVFFYSLIMVLAHAVIQEFLLDKVNKKLHLSKVKFAKFNESGQLLSFYVFSVTYAANLLWESFNMEGGYLKFLAALWTGYPEQHSIMPWGLKLFYILQIAYWVHVFPELYFTKVKKEDMSAKIQPAVMYLVCIVAGYVMHYQRIMLILLSLHYLVEAVFHLARIMYFLEKNQIAQGGFKLWNILFMLARIVSVVLSVLTFWFGMGRVEAENPDGGSSVVTRAGALSAVCLLQAWMSWNFMTFHMRRSKDAAPEVKEQKKSTKATNGTSKKKQ